MKIGVQVGIRIFVLTDMNFYNLLMDYRTICNFKIDLI
ncbi:hypothetical protein SAMN05421692_0397 [Chryseobacterium indologenes]|nr:hypothetical protein SAMN05421692_0397 [Chryseobacterium indologenes]SUX50393.1 Uncharacterised protein [Chryseobacterium indologenes]